MRAITFTIERCIVADFFNLDWEGLDDFISKLDGMEEAFFKVAKAEYNKYGLLVEAGAKSLAPEDEGSLAASINFSGIKRSGNEISGEVGTNLVYALRRHEEPYRSGTFPKYSRGAKFPNYYVNGRGVTTRGKSWRGYPAGRKYLENAVKATKADYEAMLNRIIEQTFRG